MVAITHQRKSKFGYSLLGCNYKVDFQVIEQIHWFSSRDACQFLEYISTNSEYIFCTGSNRYTHVKVRVIIMQLNFKNKYKIKIKC